ncbi:DNA cytosine methyltransferase [Mesorhizobium sp.]|uniref:DNA cytosine methyltransferase n=1 Tax=Mesorhizobium sp. TaxID=1871066 RepID=UPI0025C503A2|nr:DNA cytosine methyltransferase [Mesorhizobium sp.]
MGVGEGIEIHSSVRKPTFIDVFAGCGGLSLGLKRAGWRGLLAIERDKFAFDTLSSNFSGGREGLTYDWPEGIERRAWDISELLRIRQKELSQLAGSVDLLAGGPPCQGFSHAGRRRPDDPRNQLFEAYLELVSIVRPKAVLIENVRGFTSSFDRREHGGIVNFAHTLQERLQRDYDTISAVVKASDLGVPQSRPRFFLAGVLKDQGLAESLKGFFDSLYEYSSPFLKMRGLPKKVTARDAISDLEVGHNGAVQCFECPGFEAIDYKAPRSAYQIAMRDGFEGKPSDTRLARHRPEIVERFASIIRSSREEGRLNVSISPETRRAHGLKKMAIRVMDPLSPAPTITSLPDDLLHYSEPRTLTVRENARLQSFPDWFSFKGKYTTGGNLRTKEVPRFTQVANAVPPLVAEQIGLCLARLLTGDLSYTSLQGNTNLRKSRLLVAQLATK